MSLRSDGLLSLSLKHLGVRGREADRDRNRDKTFDKK